MNWKNILSGKRNESLVLISVVLLLAMVGFMNKKHISDLKVSIASIYEDRLVAKGYIFDLSTKVNAKRNVLNMGYGLSEEISTRNYSIDELIKSYEQTKLTLEENALLLKLKKDVSLSREFENQLIYNPMHDKQQTVMKKHVLSQYDLILGDLAELSEIQLSEGKKLLESSNEVLTFNSITSHLEIALLIVVALIFLMVVSSTDVFISKDLWHS